MNYSKLTCEYSDPYIALSGIASRSLILNLDEKMKPKVPHKQFLANRTKVILKTECILYFSLLDKRMIRVNDITENICYAKN